MQSNPGINVTRHLWLTAKYLNMKKIIEGLWLKLKLLLHSSTLIKMKIYCVMHVPMAEAS